MEKINVQDSNVEKPKGKSAELKDYRINPKTIEILAKQGIKQLFPIQLETFDLIYDQKDIMGRDITGSGKTLAYSLPLIERFRHDKLFEGARSTKSPLVMVMVPTRELAIQVSNVFEQIKYTDEYHVIALYGGTPIEPQTDALRRGTEIVVGTTGRLLDHIERGNLITSNLRCVVLDEADRMLDMGFQEDVEKIFESIRRSSTALQPSNPSAVAPKSVSQASSPQILLFSATFPTWVQRVSGKYLHPAFTLVDLVKNLTNKTASSVRHFAVFSPYNNRTSILADIILCYGGTFGKTIVFTQTKAEANELYLSEKLKDIEVLHGDIPQQQREITFRGFKEGRFHILVATDVASRGLDIPDVDLIVQCEPPKDVETYIHRSGRTARAGKEGTVVTFYTKKHAMLISKIEKLAGITFTKIGAPQPEDIIKASSKFIIEGLKKVSPEALPLFADTADLLIKEFGEKKALLLTLAYISGNLNMIKKRSILSGTEDFVTYQIETEKDFRTVSYIWGILKKILTPEQAEQIRQMRCYKNNMGAAFDIPDKLTASFEKAYEEEMSKQKFMTYKIKKASELPDLKEFEQFGNGFERRPNNYYDRHEVRENRGGWGGSKDIDSKVYAPRFRRADGPIKSKNKSKSRSKSRSRSHNRSRSRKRSRSRSKSRSDSRSRSRSRSKSRNYSGKNSHSRSRSRSRSKSKSKSPPRGEQRYSRGFPHRPEWNTNSGRPRNENVVFMWGLETENDIKDFLTENKIGWEKIKVLVDEKGESKLCSFITLEKFDIEAALKLNGTRVGKRQLKISLAIDKHKKQ